LAPDRRRSRAARLIREQGTAARLRVAVDATPLLGQLTGIGRYTAELLRELAAGAGEEPRTEVIAMAFTWRGHDQLPQQLPSGVTAVGRRAPARLLQASWARTDLPTMPMLGVRADVVHGTNFVLPPPGRRAAGVVTIHDLSYLRFPETVSIASARYRELVPRSLRRASLVIADTQALAEEIAAEYRLDPDRIRAIPLGVDPDWFEEPAPLPPELGLPDRYLLFVGTLEPRKNLATLLTAFRELRRQDPATPPLVLAGPSGWGPALDTAGLGPGDVRQVGYLDGPALRSVVAHAGALCYPSLYEGFGLPPLEALAAGTPVVASDLAPLREVLTGAGDAVRFFPPRDSGALAQAISSTLAAPGEPGKGVAHARRFTWVQTASLTEMAYRDAVS
jgi:glycosyltransferase involved in cell wall biosynthesis